MQRDVRVTIETEEDVEREKATIESAATSMVNYNRDNERKSRRITGAQGEKAAVINGTARGMDMDDVN